MKPGLALALLTLATSVVVSAQIHGVPPSVTSLGPGRGPNPGVPASVTSLGPRGFAGTFSPDRGHGGIPFGHHPGFITGFRNREFHRHSVPVIVAPYYWPYYGWDYPFGGYDFSAYQAQPYPQQTQPIIVVVDPKASEDRYGDHSFYEGRNPPPPPQAQPQALPAPVQEQEPTLLVFRDGHKREIRNYAIVGPMLWDFASKGTHTIPLSDLDLEATRKLNDERGVDFVLPKT
jgi:hypothetical protein